MKRIIHRFRVRRHALGPDGFLVPTALEVWCKGKKKWKGGKGGIYMYWMGDGTSDGGGRSRDGDGWNRVWLERRM